jgi:predicted TIM-barrel fold metal-dependent hydrolase
MVNRMERFTVISADCHAGADLLGYREYLEPAYREEFDAWAASYVSPFSDLTRPEAVRNWDHGVRTEAFDADGVAGEVVYPNTVPPFFPLSGLLTLVPTPEEYEQRLAGQRAHNRWLVDFCALAPERRAGIGQIFLNDVDDAVEDIHWIAEHGLRGGVLLPVIPPGSALDQLHSPRYEPVWRACEERGVILNVHGGSGQPDLGMHPASISLFVLEASFYSHRPLWALIMAGVFDRYPGLQLVIAEAGTSWVRPALDAMDRHYEKILAGNVGVLSLANAARTQRRPSEYWSTNCWIGSSFMVREDALDRDLVGVDRIMWGSDFPHDEGTYPHSREAIAHTFDGIPADEVAQMVGGNAARLYGFDLDALAAHATNGPRVDDVARGLDAIPDSVSLAFEPRATGVA